VKDSIPNFLSTIAAGPYLGAEVTKPASAMFVGDVLPVEIKRIDVCAHRMDYRPFFDRVRLPTTSG
jgi:hypothetical protein